MPLQIPLSQIGDRDAFKARVEAFRQAKLDHHKTEGEPAPREHEWVEACVRRVPGEGGPDCYEVVPFDIVDDRPSLRARKDALIHAVSAEEARLLEASLPPGKRRLQAMQAHDVLGKPAAERSEADKEFLAAHDGRIKHEAAIQRHAAQQMAAIEDLTEETIAKWQPAPFPS